MKYWFLNALCGLVLLVLLGGHMATMHLDDVMALVTGGSTEPLSFGEVSRRGTSLPMAIAYIVLLATALIHGLYGMHTLLTERWPGVLAAARIRAGCWLVGVVIFVVGAGGTVVFYLQGAGS